MKKTSPDDNRRTDITRRPRWAFTLVEVAILIVLLVLLGVLIAWGVRRTNRVASLKALRDIGVQVSMTEKEVVEEIRFENCFLGDELMVNHVSRLGTFTSLAVSNTDVSDVGLRAIPDPSALVSLDLTLTGITDESLKFIGENCHNLETISLTATLISDDGLAHLIDLPKLKNLALSETRVTDRGLPHLLKMKSLTHLKLLYTCISGQSLDGLPVCKNLKELHLDEDSALDRQSAVWRLFPDTSLTISYSSQIEISETAGSSASRRRRVKTEPQWTNGVRFPPKSSNIPVRNRRIAVEVPAVEFVQQAGGDAYGDLHITRIDLTADNINDTGVRLLYPFRMISNLQLSGTKITDEISNHLAGFRHLTTLQLSKTKVRDETARAMAQLPLLRELDLRHTEITDDGVRFLTDCDRLLILDISNTKVSDGGLRRLLQSEHEPTSARPASEESSVEEVVMGSNVVVKKKSQSLTGLRILGLSGTRITDESIDVLLSSTTLKEISVAVPGSLKKGSPGFAKNSKVRCGLSFSSSIPPGPSKLSSPVTLRELLRLSDSAPTTAPVARVESGSED